MCVATYLVHKTYQNISRSQDLNLQASYLHHMLNLNIQKALRS